MTTFKRHSSTVARSAGIIMILGLLFLTNVNVQQARAAGASAGWIGTTGALNEAHSAHTATLLTDGTVLVVGAGNPERYYPETGTWSYVAPLSEVDLTNHSATLLPNGKVLVVGGTSQSAAYVNTAELYDPATNTWSSGGTLVTGRYAQTATLLHTGKVLITGGTSASNTYENTAELYDPATNTWSSAAPLSVGRLWHSATLLSDGRVLVVAGRGLSGLYMQSTEIYDTATDTWTISAPLSIGRNRQAATLLHDGRVLIAGGANGANIAELYNPTTNSWSNTLGGLSFHNWPTLSLLPSGKVLITGGASYTELFDPVTNTWSDAGSMTAYRFGHTATLLASGTVLVAGGFTSGTSAEFYDPGLNIWTTTAAMSAARAGFTTTLLPNGKVLVTGGTALPVIQSSAELYDPGSNTWSSAGTMSTPRVNHTATLLPNGKVLVVGGGDASQNSLAGAEFYDPGSNTWQPAASMAGARQGHTATLLPNGTILVAGGSTNGGYLNSAEVYDPATDTWSNAGTMSAAQWGRYAHTATLLQNGLVLIAGGDSVTTTAELYDSTTNSWSSAGAMSIGRQYHTATLLPNGTVLVTGGDLSSAGPSADIYDPATNTWHAAPAMANARANHTATLLQNGLVLIDGGNGIADAELYDPALNMWRSAGTPNTMRTGHSATILPNGAVFLAGGVSPATQKSSEIYSFGLGYAPVQQPVISGLTGTPLTLNTALNVAGQNFSGYTSGTGNGGSEVGGGATNSSATNYPLVQIRSLDNEETLYLPLSTWSQSTANTLPGSYSLAPGYALLTVYTSGIPSQSRMVQVASTGTGPLAAHITYAKVSGATAHSASVEWAAREANIIGYNLYAGSQKLNPRLIPAHHTIGQPDGIYTATVSLPKGTNSVTIADVAAGGKETRHTYRAGSTFGTAPVATSAVHPAPDVTEQTPAAKPIHLANQDAAVSIATDGIYHLTYAQLVAQGIDLKGVHPAKLALSTAGASVSLYVKTAKASTFAAGDWIEFVASAQDDTYNGSRVYVLTDRPAGTVTHLTQPPSVSLAPKPGDPAATTISRELPGRRFYWAAAPAAAPAWDWALGENDVPQLADQSIAFDLPRLYNTGTFATQTVNVTLHLRGWGGYNTGTPDHHAVADLAGVHGDVKFAGNATATISLNIPASALSATGNNVRLRAPGDLGFAYDTFLLESVSVSYPQATALPPSLLAVARTRGYTRAAELTKDISAQAKGNALDYLIIANTAFVAGVQPLAAQHRAEKMHVAVEDANALYDVYGDGSTNPDTLKAAIAALTKTRGLKYVLLVGADNIDPRDYAKQGDRSFVPAYHAPDSQGTRAPSDAPFAPAGVALGRLPVTTTAELTTLVVKTIAFIHSSGATSATFVSDPTDAYFGSMSRDAAAALPKGTPSTQVTWTSGDFASVDKATHTLVSQWQTGSRIISYTGHSNAGVWADDSVLDSSQLRAIQQGKPALVAVWGCWAGTYDSTFGGESLSQQLLSLSGGGAASMVASTTEVSADEYAPVSQAFYAALYAGGKSQRIGDAFVTARTAIPQGGTDLQAGLTLLGDPAARI